MATDYNEEFTTLASWVATHNLNNDTPLVDVMVSGFGGEREKVLPTSIVATDANTVTVTFAGTQSGTVRIIG